MISAGAFTRTGNQLHCLQPVGRGHDFIQQKD
jgi:hypothetical protein